MDSQEIFETKTTTNTPGATGILDHHNNEGNKDDIITNDDVNETKGNMDMVTHGESNANIEMDFENEYQ